jgi:transcriptional regulator with XRE-family HTH domain
LPFSRLRLTGVRPRMLPRGYPHEPRTLGERIRRRRMDLGLTQRTLAERLGCWEQSVARWERDLGEPGPRRWSALEAVLGPGLLAGPEDLAGQIRTARLRLGLTQAELARRAGIDERTVLNCESGARAPRRETLRKLRNAIGPWRSDLNGRQLT